MTGKGVDEDFKGLRGADTLNGGGGFDKAWYDNDRDFGGSKGINANLGTGKISDGWGHVDTVSNIEGVIGTVKADRFVGNAQDNQFQGLAGKDSFNGGAGFDVVDFNANGEDWAGPANVVGVRVDLNATNEIINDGFGNVENADSIEKVDGSFKNDTFRGDNLENDFNGGRGADILDGRGGPDHLGGNQGHDTMTGGAGGDIFNFHEEGTAADSDTITDFDRTEGDEIGLNNNGLDGVSNGTLAASAFSSGAGFTTATTAAHRLIYNTSDGRLYFDHDGVGGDAATFFAILSGAPTLFASDVFVFS